MWVVGSDKFPAHITEVLLAWLQNILIAFSPCIIWGTCRLHPWSQMWASNLHPLLLLPIYPFLFSQQSASVRANPSSLVELRWGWIQLIALAWKDPKGGSYHLLWLPPSAYINPDSCTVSRFLGRKESALSPHAYYKGCFQQHATVISGAQLGNFNPLLSSLGLLVMQPAFTQHNGCYLPMCFEGYC